MELAYAALMRKRDKLVGCCSKCGDGLSIWHMLGWVGYSKCTWVGRSVHEASLCVCVCSVEGGN